MINFQTYLTILLCNFKKSKVFAFIVVAVAPVHHVVTLSAVHLSTPHYGHSISEAV